MAILAIDQSTQATKAMVFDENLVLLGAHSVNHQQYYPTPGWVEHDMEEVLDNLYAAAGQAIAACPGGTKITCVSISNQRETLVLWDAKTGKPACRAIVWQDARAAQDLADIAHTAKTVYELSGMPLSPLFSAAKLRYAIKFDANVRALLQENRLRAGTVDAYLSDRLCGRFACDYTNASRTQLMNLKTLAWDETLLEIFGVDKAILPEILPSDEIFGYTDLNGILPEKVPLCGVMGDSQGAFFALGCHESGRAKVSYGTGSSVMVHVGQTPTLSDKLAATVGYKLKNAVGYALEGNISHSADIVTWLTRDMKLCDSPAKTQEMAQSVPDNGGVKLIPAFTGLGAPWFEPQARACIWGMSRDATPAHIVRAGLEAIAFQIADVLNEMSNSAHVPVIRLDGDGGASRNGFLMQFQSDLLGIPLEIAQAENLSALGVAMAGGIGTGLFTDGAQAAAKCAQRTAYTPSQDAQKAKEAHAAWAKVRDIVIQNANS